MTELLMNLTALAETDERFNAPSHIKLLKKDFPKNLISLKIGSDKIFLEIWGRILKKIKEKEKILSRFNIFCIYFWKSYGSTYCGSVTIRSITITINSDIIIFNEIISALIGNINNIRV